MKSPIAGSVMKGYEVRKGRHQYEEGNPEVVEIAFTSGNCNYIQVISIETARELAASLKYVLNQD